jgi:ketosteroid isomerase-like protein
MQRTTFARSARRLVQAANTGGALRIVQRVPPTAAEVTDQLYARWNDDGLSVLTDTVDPAIELICDPLRPAESTLRGLAGWKQWVARWDDSYEAMHITIDGLIPMSDEHVLALVSITATPRGRQRELNWAAAHVWTVRDGRIARWETHVDIALARGTLL